MASDPRQQMFSLERLELRPTPAPFDPTIGAALSPD
jgi:hypothetical protein